MSTTELKEQLIERINKTEDVGLLEDISKLMDIQSDEFVVYSLSENQKTAIEEAREQIRKGQSLTHEQANNEIDNWLNR